MVLVDDGAAALVPSVCAAVSLGFDLLPQPAKIMVNASTKAILILGNMFIYYALDRSTSSGDLFKMPLLLSSPITTVNKVIMKKMATTGKKLTE